MIDTTKTYRTKEGLKARFVGKINNPDYPLIFAVEDSDGDEHVQTYTRNGCFYSDVDSEYNGDDLVEYNPWADVAVDTPVYVRHDDREEWQPRHFAKVKDGRVYVWADGGTSFTSTYSVGWDCAKLKD